MSKKIRVIIADDSALMRKKISEILNSDKGIEVIAVVRNGREALEAVYALKPDVVTLDVQMPLLNGIDTLGYIMSEVPTPCLMISAFTRAGAQETMRALEFGAVDFITKPSGAISSDIEKIGREIIEKVKIAAGARGERLKLIWAEKAQERERLLKKPKAISKVFTIASSTGGTQALATIIPALRADLPAAFLVVQHMPEGFTKSLSERLNWQSRISVAEAEDKMPLKPGEVIIARGGMHMAVGGSVDSAHVLLSSKPPRLGVRPCADIMMESAARIFQKQTVGIVLTGMGSDGTLGAYSTKSKGGIVIAEDELSCVVYGMPKSAVESGVVDKVIPLHRIAGEMEKLVLGAMC